VLEATKHNCNLFPSGNDLSKPLQKTCSIVKQNNFNLYFEVSLNSESNLCIQQNIIPCWEGGNNCTFRSDLKRLSWVRALRHSGRHLQESAAGESVAVSSRLT